MTAMFHKDVGKKSTRKKRRGNEMRNQPTRLGTPDWPRKDGKVNELKHQTQPHPFWLADIYSRVSERICQLRDHVQPILEQAREIDVCSLGVDGLRYLCVLSGVWFWINTIFAITYYSVGVLDAVVAPVFHLQHTTDDPRRTSMINQNVEPVEESKPSAQPVESQHPDVLELKALRKQVKTQKRQLKKRRKEFLTTQQGSDRQQQSIEKKLKEANRQTQRLREQSRLDEKKLRKELTRVRTAAKIDVSRSRDQTRLAELKLNQQMRKTAKMEQAMRDRIVDLEVEVEEAHDQTTLAKQEVKRLMEAKKIQEEKQQDGLDQSDECCVVCEAQPRTHVAVPCGHLATCESCSEQITQECCICRRKLCLKTPYLRLHAV